KSIIACSAPTGKWGNARRQFLSHRSFYPFDPRGKAMKLDILKSESTYLCPDRQIGKCEEAAPQPPQTLLFATSSRRSSIFLFDPEGQGAEARHLEKHNRLFCPDRQMGKCEEAVPQPPELLSI
ncbi:MAG: hypothetical protein ABS934_01170, partial [Psychrobacillus sp.]